VRDDKWGERPLALINVQPEFQGKIVGRRFVHT